MAEEKETSVNEDQSAVEKSVENSAIEEKTTSSISDKIDLEKIIGEKSYEFYLANKKPVNVVVAILAVILIGIVGYKFIYIDRIFNPKQTESLEAIWRAENQAFDNENWNTAIYGDSLGLYDGFLRASEEYEGYIGGKLAQYNLGISYLNSKEYTLAIETLEKVNFEDELLGTITLGAIGDAFLQLGSVNDALENYERAYNRKENELTTPIYLMKAALCLEILEDYEMAINLYRDVMQKYPLSSVANNAEKYMESLLLGKPVYQFEKEVSE